MSRSELVESPSRGAAAGVAGVVELAAQRIEVAGALVLRAVDLRLGAGELIGVAGSNGAGKSTLLRALAGLVTGPEVRRYVDPAWAGRAGTAVALVGHEPSLHPRLTLGQNLQLAFELADVRDLSVADTLERVGLAGAVDRPAGACSHGMQRRADLARAWASRPALLLLDEPTAGLDAASAALPAELARDTLARGGSVVVASHADVVGLDGVAARRVRIESGEVIAWP